MNKNLMPHEIKLSDWEETYESPIDMIVQQMSSEFHRMAENQLLLRVNQAVDFNVDKAELLKALQYDREQYEKGYLDAKKKYVKNGKWIMDRIVPPLSDSCRFVPMCSECQLHFDTKTRYCPNCGAYMMEDKE